jgi:RNA polymerase sigma-70 factor (ECF subfamily)
VRAEDLDVLARRLQGGDKKAFAELFAVTRREVRIFLSAYASSADMVDEVLQSAYVTCYEKIAAYQPRGTFLAWLKGIARNLLLKELTERCRYVATQGDELEGMLIDESLTSLALEREEGEERSRKLEECFSKLPPHAREILTQRYREQVPLRKLATSFNKTETWIAVTLHRLREALRVCMMRAEPGV